MKILFIADGRSPIAINWIRYFITTGYEVHLASTYPCQPIPGSASLDILPVAMSGLYSQSMAGGEGKGKLLILKRILPVSLRTRIRQLVVPISFSRAINVLQDVLSRIQPDLVHAMRIPFEGMIASQQVKRVIKDEGNSKRPPLLISVWGNDFTLHARSTPVMAAYTRQALEYCDALHTDCQRDMNLALKSGFATEKPGLVMPVGGVKTDIFYPLEEGPSQGGNHHGEQAPLKIINPRGFRAYVRNDTFFHAIPSVLQRFPQVRFVCPGMAGEVQAIKWIAELGIGDNVDLLPPQSHKEMPELFRQSQISLSISTHDGTPNSLLEALASGCFPIAGDIESIREWIIPEVNGYLVDPGDSQALAKAIINAISQPDMRKQAKEYNLKMIRERAEYTKIMHQAEELYSSLVNQH